MTDRELLKMVLMFLSYDDETQGYRHTFEYEEELEKLCSALRARLAEPEQEPVAWMQNTTAGLYVEVHPDQYHTVPLYTAPPTASSIRRQAMEECLAIATEHGRDKAGVAAAIRKLKEGT